MSSGNEPWNRKQDSPRRSVEAAEVHSAVFAFVFNQTLSVGEHAQTGAGCGFCDLLFGISSIGSLPLDCGPLTRSTCPESKVDSSG